MQQAAFFDLDGTITNMKTEKMFGLHLYKEKKLPKLKLLKIVIAYLKYDLHLAVSYEKMKREIIKMNLSGIDKQEYKNLFYEFFDRVLVKNFNPDVVKAIELHKQQKHQVYIVTAALDFIAERYARHLGTDGFLATRLIEDANQYTGEIAGRIHYGREKANAVLELAGKQNIDLKKSYAYGDYYEDKYLLEITGNPVAVNPDSKLEKYAREKQWKMILSL